MSNSIDSTIRLFRCRRLFSRRILITSTVFGFFPFLASAETQPTPSDLIGRHLDALGSSEALAKVRFRVAEGVIAATGRVFKQKGHKSGIVLGHSYLEASSEQFRLTLLFDSRNYPIDGFFLVGGELRRPALSANSPSFLPEFFAKCPGCLEDGLLGGVLSPRWPLLNRGQTNPPFDVLGREELDDKELIAVRYHSRKGRMTKLYFDPDTWRHVATRYRRPIGRGRGYRTGEVFMEEFRAFETIDGLCLPTLWSMTLLAPQDTTEWEVEFSRIEHPEGPVLKRPLSPSGR